MKGKGKGPCPLRWLLSEDKIILCKEIADVARENKVNIIFILYFVVLPTGKVSCHRNMMPIGLSHLLQILTCILLLTQSFCQDDPKTYIVYMGVYPEGLQSTKLLHTTMVQDVLGSKFATDALLHSYKSFNGFVAKLTDEEAIKMRGLEGVVSVIENRVNKPQTSRSWDFIGFPENVQRSNLESDIIVGVLDSGIWPESYSFDGSNFGPTPKPPKWNGGCFGSNFTCNNKLIGAKYTRISGVVTSDDIISARDTSGHGTHCASTAAGNVVSSASLFDLGYGTVRGGVPSARIAVYKVCWSKGCDDADILAGFDEAIADGVHVLSVSLGPTQVFHTDYFNDVFAVGSFHAMKNGILTSKSADNLGPKAYTISNTAPWILSVAASTIDRKFFTNLQLGNGRIYQGVSLNTFDLKNTMYRLTFAGDIPNINGGYNSSVSRYCYKHSLNEALARGRIVLCDGYIGSGKVGFVSGAVGAIFSSTGSLSGADVFALPAIHVNAETGNLIYSYLKSVSNPTATIFKSYEGKDSNAPYVASFSSRGPNAITPDILKPDITAPGVDILAAWSPISPISGVKGDNRIAYFNIISGTSMACPHVTGAAAYIKSFYPYWSPAAIKSALMTTATPMSAALNKDAEFAYGAGQLNPIRALNPGLVYDANEVDYVQFLCGQGYDTRSLRAISGDSSTCTQANRGYVWDLNLPSFTISTRYSTYTSVVFHRTVTNVGFATSKYVATIATYPSTLKIQVVPNVLTFSSLGQKLSFRVQIEGYITRDIVSSSLVWSDGTHQVRSPVVVYVRQ
ncbi:hypothetical protein RJT34_11622 [Clitoria ternatea]|uniref:Cucumisin n=1 Tax=Clitoria ternatea TaxID=43366 RepID=A0AAN9JMV3_CLITE